MQQMSKRYETNNGCKTAWTKWTFKQGDEQKQIYILQQINLHWYIKEITNSTNKIIVCIYVSARVCVCVCKTTKLQKELQV